MDRVKEQHQLVTSTAVLKILNDCYPVWFKHEPSVRDVTNSITRQQNFLYVPKTKTDAGASNLNVLGPKMLGLRDAVVAHSAHNREGPGSIPGWSGKNWAIFPIPHALVHPAVNGYQVLIGELCPVSWAPSLWLAQ